MFLSLLPDANSAVERYLDQLLKFHKGLNVLLCMQLLYPYNIVYTCHVVKIVYSGFVLLSSISGKLFHVFLWEPEIT